MQVRASPSPDRTHRGLSLLAPFLDRGLCLGRGPLLDPLPKSGPPLDAAAAPSIPPCVPNSMIRVACPHLTVSLERTGAEGPHGHRAPGSLHGARCMNARRSSRWQSPLGASGASPLSQVLGWARKHLKPAPLSRETAGPTRDSGCAPEPSPPLLPVCPSSAEAEPGWRGLPRFTACLCRTLLPSCTRVCLLELRRCSWRTAPPPLPSWGLGARFCCSARGHPPSQGAPCLAMM